MSDQKYIIQMGEAQWSTIAIASVGLLIAYYFVLYDDGASLALNKSNTQRTLTEEQDKLRQTKIALEDVAKFEAKLGALREKFNLVTSKMPESMSGAAITSLISRQATLAGTKVSRIEPIEKIEKASFYDIVQVKVALDTSFSQLLTFLSYLSRVQDLLTFAKVKIDVNPSSRPESPRLNFEGTISGYRYIKQEADSTAGAGTGTGQGGSK